MEMKIILTSDWHLRDTPPVCRTDDFMATQRRKIEFITTLQKRYDNAPVLIAGDLFDRWNPSVELLRIAYGAMPHSVYMVAGNHDLKRHSMKLFQQAGLSILHDMKVVTVLTKPLQLDIEGKEDVTVWPVNWKDDPPAPKKLEGINIVLSHEMCFEPRKPPYPGATGNARDVMKKYPWADLIVTGHNHASFSMNRKGRWIVNAGAILRQRSSDLGQLPHVYVYDTGTLEVCAIPIPIEDGAVSEAHLKRNKVECIDSTEFISKLKDVRKASISFRSNMEQYLDQNNVKRSVEKKIWQAMS
jgi:DNA repair exonuclease SbcCD nuclease subunit